MNTKILLYSVIALSLLIYKNLMAQEEVNPKLNNGFYISFLPLITNTLQFSYERKIHNNSLVISPRYTSIKNSKYYNNYWYYAETPEGYGIGVELQYRIDLSGNPKKEKEIKNYNKYFRSDRKIYFTPFVTYDYLEIDIQTNDIINRQVNIARFISSISGGVMFGIKWPIAQRLFLDTYLGAGYRSGGDPSIYYSNEFTRHLFRPGYSGIIPKGGIQLGFIF